MLLERPSCRLAGQQEMPRPSNANVTTTAVECQGKEQELEPIEKSTKEVS